MVDLLGGVAEPSPERAVELESERKARVAQREKEANEYRERKRRIAFDGANCVDPGGMVISNGRTKLLQLCLSTENCADHYEAFHAPSRYSKRYIDDSREPTRMNNETMHQLKSKPTATQTVPIDVILRKFYFNLCPAGQPVNLPLVDAIARLAGKAQKKVVKPFERYPDRPHSGIVPGDITEDSVTLARILEPYSKQFPSIPNETVRRVVGILDDIAPHEVAAAIRELERTKVGQILQDFSFCNAPTFANAVILRPSLMPRSSVETRDRSTVNQAPLVIWRNEDGHDYCGRTISAWRLKEGLGKVFFDHPRCPLAWIVPPIAKGAGPTSIRGLALICLRQSIYLDAMQNIYKEILGRGGLRGCDVGPISASAIPDARPPCLPHPDVLERSMWQWSVATGKIIVVHFGAKGAGPCKIVREEWSKTLASADEFIVLERDVEDYPHIFISMAVTAVPTIVIYGSTGRIYRGEGAISSDEVRRIVRPSSLPIGRKKVAKRPS